MNIFTCPDCKVEFGDKYEDICVHPLVFDEFCCGECYDKIMDEKPEEKEPQGCNARSSCGACNECLGLCWRDFA
jgi:hypothetical protein